MTLNEAWQEAERVAAARLRELNRLRNENERLKKRIAQLEATALPANLNPTATDRPTIVRKGAGFGGRRR